MVNQESFYSKNTPREVRRELGRLFGIRSDSSLGKYLGLPTEIGRSKKEVLKLVKTRLLSFAEGWSELGTKTISSRERGHVEICCSWHTGLCNG